MCEFEPTIRPVVAAGVSNMTAARCPTCNKLFDPAKTAYLPFCSERCRMADLNRWLSEEHGVPVDPDDAEEFDRESPHPGNGDRHESGG
jgi:endogenous inhibitor of DNA gyrase (YacG/DUF329 family)